MPAAAIMGMAGGVGILSSAASSLAQYQQGQYASIAARRQAEGLQVQSQEVQQQVGSQIAADDYRAAHLLSRISAVSAASGVAPGDSSELSADTSAEEARINDMYAQYSANIQSSNLEYQGQLLQTQGEEEAGAATTGALFNFTGNLADLGMAYSSGKEGSISRGTRINGVNYSDPLLYGQS